MSFMRTLATVAVGFAAAKGVEKYQKMGGMAGLQRMMQQGGAASIPGMADFGKMAESMGLGGLMQGLPAGMGQAGAAANPFQQMMGAFMGGAETAQTAGAAGLGGLLAAFQGAAAASGQRMDEMMGAMAGAAPVTEMMEESAKLMLRAMILAAKADGEIDAEEREKILGSLGDVSAEERAFVERELDAPLDPVGLAQDTTEAARAQVYASSLMAIHLDNQREMAYLAQLSQALGLSADMRDRMHAAMGVPPLAV